MIFLKSGDRELVRVANWDEIEQLPGFTVGVDPTEHKLSQIIGSYAFQDRHPCGLKTCRQPHGNGYVATTVAGLVTNLGKDCGKTHFGLDWTVERKRFDAEVSNQINKEQLRLFAAQLPAIETRIENLRSGDRSVNWIHTNVTALKNPSKVSSSVVSLISDLVRRSSPTITRPRLKSDDEMQLEPGSARYVDESVAVLRGFEVLLPVNDLRTLVAVQLTEKKKEFCQLTIDLLSASELKKWSIWSGTVEQSLSTAEKTMEAGRAFFTKDNLRPLCEEISIGKDKEQFLGYLKNLPN